MVDKDITYGVKVSKEIKEKVLKMVEDSGHTSKEFFEIMVQTYQLESIKAGSPRYSEDLREVEALLSRVNQVICNLATKGDAEILVIQKKQQENELVQIEQTKALEEKNNSLLTSLKNVEKELSQALESKDIAEKQAQSAADALDQSKDLIFEYKTKTEALSNLATKNQIKADDYDQAVVEARRLSEQLEQLKVDHRRENEKMIELMEQTKAGYKREIEIMADNLLRAQGEAQKDQVVMLDKIEFLEKNFQNERNGFQKERSGFEVRIAELKKAYEREIQLVKENAEAKIEAIATASAMPKRYLSRKAKS